MNKILLVIFSFLFFSFENNLDKKKTIEIKIDVDSIKEFKVENYLKDILVLTKENKPYLLGVADNIFTVNDGYIIYDYEKGINKFDFEGRFIKQIPYKCRTNEYGSYFVDLWIKNDSIFIYDSMNEQILIYNNQGDFVTAKLTIQKDKKNNFKRLLSYGNKYFGKKADVEFDAKTGLTYFAFAIYNSEFEYIKDFSNLKKDVPIIHSASTSFPDRISLGTTTFNDEVLYVEDYNYDIFSINSSEIISKKYFINFMKYAAPKDYIKDNFKAYATGNQRQYVAALRCIYESNDYLCFVFIYGKESNFAVYDKETKKVKSFRIVNSNDYSIRNLFLKDDMVICYLQSKKDVAILKVKFKDIIK